MALNNPFTSNEGNTEDADTTEAAAASSDASADAKDNTGIVKPQGGGKTRKARNRPSRPAGKMRERYDAARADITDRLERLIKIIHDMTPSDLRRNHLEPLMREHSKMRTLQADLEHAERADAQAAGQDLITGVIAETGLDAETVARIRANGGSPLEQMQALMQAVAEAAHDDTSAEGATS